MTPRSSSHMARVYPFGGKKRGVQACLDDNALAELATGKASEPRRAAAEAHLAGCASCREVLAAVMSSSLARSSPASPPLRQGDAVGRFTVLKSFGAGA